MSSSSLLSGFTCLALSYIATNDFDNALRAFQHALSSVGRDDDCSDASLATSAQPIIFKIRSIPKYGCSYHLVPINSDEVYIEALIGLQGHSTLLTFYNQVFVISDDNMIPSIASAMLLYNMATISHYQGIVTNSVQCINKAVRMYRMTLCMLQNNDAASTTASNILPLLLAAHNNMGHASLILHSRDDYIWCINQLKYMMDVFGPTAELPIDDISFSVTLLNIYGLSLAVSAPCA